MPPVIIQQEGQVRRLRQRIFKTAQEQAAIRVSFGAAWHSGCYMLHWFKSYAACRLFICPK